MQPNDKFGVLWILVQKLGLGEGEFLPFPSLVKCLGQIARAK